MRKINAPLMKLMKIIVKMEFFVLGRVVIYLDNPATLLILDIFNPL